MERRGDEVITEKPELRRPYMVCGISGWVDGGEAATGTVRYLVSELGARRFADIPVDRFHIFQVPGQLTLRPQIRVENGLLKEHHFPQNQFFYWVNPAAANDLILFLGTEPNLNWEAYAEAILNIAEEFAVSRIYLLGGVLDRTPHTRDPAVSCTCSSANLKAEMRRYGMQFSNYEGPGRFGTTLLYLCQRRRVPMVCLTARATYYPEFNVLIPRNPKSIRALLRRLKGLLNIRLDTSDIDIEADEMEAKLDLMVGHNPELQAYVEELEKDFVEDEYGEPLDISPIEGVRIAEEFLKGKDKG